MVRAIVGTLLEVGKGKISVGDFVEIVERKDRGEAGTSVPPQGLFLVDIEYKAWIRECVNDIMHECMNEKRINEINDFR